MTDPGPEVRGIVRDGEGRILLVRCADRPGRTLPGGRLGPEEHSLAQTLRRAVGEETGLEIMVESLRAIVGAVDREDRPLGEHREDSAAAADRRGGPGSTGSAAQTLVLDARVAEEDDSGHVDDPTSGTADTLWVPPQDIAVGDLHGPGQRSAVLLDLARSPSAARPAEDAEEIWDLTDRSGAPLDRTHRRGDLLPGDVFHLVACVCVVRGDGRILVTRRAEGKAGWPLLWELPGGSALAGETTREAAHRELLEEVGLHADPARFELIGRSTEGSALVDLYLVRLEDPGELLLEPAEVCETDWLLPLEVDQLLSAGSMAAPWTVRLERLGAELHAALGSRGR